VDSVERDAPLPSPASESVGLLLPLIALIVLALLGTCLVVASLVRKQDSNAEAATRVLVSGAIRREQRSLADTTYLAARWDDAVDHVYPTLDRDWARLNLSYPMTSYIIDGRGNTLWSLAPRGRGTAMKLTPATAGALPLLIASLPRTQRDAERWSTGRSFLTSFGTKPAIMSVMAITPLYRKRRLGELRHLVLVRPLDEPVLASWRDAYGLGSLRWMETFDASSSNHLPVKSATGTPLGTLVWPVNGAGHDALRGILPMLLSIGVLFVAVSLWLIRLIHRAQGRLVEGARAAHSAATRAKESADEATQALIEARAARERADQLARRELSDRAHHEATLRESQRSIARNLRTSLAALLSELLNSANALERSAETTIAVIAEQQAKAGAIRQGSREAMMAAEAISSTLTGLSLSIAEIVSSSEDARIAANAAFARSAEAKSTNSNLIDNIDQIRDSVNLIARISKQTNLLALNATIEAAHAGEAGKGFTVVATEVKDLAQQASGGAETIERRINGVSAAANDTVGLVSDLDEAIVSLVTQISRAAATAQQQRDAVECIQQSSTEISSNAKASDDTVGAISEALVHVASTAASTRAIGMSVRTNAAELDARFASLVESLEI